ncbi:MAG: sulfotransferase [Planctomycetota bacterium]|nr:MAG: sulfotransferase [Planctomycetota bacterium]
MKAPAFFILGSQRSGTTLLRLVLNAHSQVAIPEEGTAFLPLIQRRDPSLSAAELQQCLKYLRSSPHLHLWNVDLEDLAAPLQDLDSCSTERILQAFYQGYGRLHGKTVVGEKSPSFSNLWASIPRHLPEAKILWIVRDPRDVFLSWRKMDPNKSDPLAFAFDWKFKQRGWVQAMRRKAWPESWFLLRYEELVTEPQATVEKICQFLEIPYEAEMLNFFESSSKFIGTHHSEKIFQPVSRGSVEKWRKELEIGSRAIIERVNRREFQIAGYQAAGRGAGAALLPMMKGLAWGLPKRSLSVLRTRIGMRRGLKTGQAPIPESIGKKAET